MAEYVVAQAAVLIVPTLGKGNQDFRVQLRKLLASVREEVEVEAKLDGKKLRAQFQAEKAWLESQKININTRINPKQLTEIRHLYEDLSRDFKKGLILDLKITGMTLLPQLAQGLAAANASLVQLSQSALLLPGILSGAVASVAGLATGLSGVKAAFKEYRDAQKNAAQEGLKARNSAINVQNAYRDLGRSIKDAKRNLEDLNAQLRDAPLDEADAIIRVAEAQAEAADRAGKSGLQQQKDLLSLKKAENELVNVRLRNSRLVQDVAEANAKGVAGADSVREATDRLSKAQDEANTQATKLTDSLKELSPNAQAAGKALADVDSKWQALKISTQDRLFAGIDQEITQLAQVALPTLEKGFGKIADGLNSNIKSAFSALKQPDSQSFLDTILGDTAAAQSKLSGIFDPLLGSFLKLSVAGSAYLPQLVEGLTRVLERFDNFVNRASGDGSLDEWINNGINALSQLGNAMLNLGSIFNSISEAFTGSGGKGMLQLLEEATGRLSEFLKSDKGQQQLIDFFRSAREQLDKWKPLLSELPDLFTSLSKAGQKVADIMLPWLRTVTQFLGDHPKLVATAITAWAGWKTINPIVKGVNKLLDTEIVGVLKKMPGEVATAYKSFNLMNGYGVMAGAREATKQLGRNIGEIASMVSPTGLAFVGISGFAMLLANRYMEVQNDAATAAQAHADALRNIATQIDDVTSKLTQKGLLDKLRELRSYTNQNFQGKPKQDIVELAKQFNISETDLANALNLNDPAGSQAVFDAIQERVKTVIADSLKGDNNPYSRTLKPELDKRGFTFNDMVAALAGDKTQAERFNSFGNLGFTLTDVLKGSGFGPYRIPGLSDQAVAASQVGKALTEDRRNTASVMQQNTADVTAIGGGRLPLNANNPFNQLGNPEAYKVADGSGNVAITVNTSKEDILSRFPELAKNIETGGGYIDPLGGSMAKIVLKPDRAKLYIPGLADGGLISGPGTGRSDSIVTRLSRGEYVVNAASTQKNLGLLEAINSGGMQGFAGGGMPIIPQAPSPAPAPPPTPPAQGTLSVGASGVPTRGDISTTSFPPLFPPGSSAAAPIPVTAAPPPKPAGVAPGSPAPVSGGTIPTSTDSRVNPNTTVHSGTKPSAGPGNVIPHQVAGLPARPGPYQMPVVSLGGINPAALADYAGLPAGSAINYGQGGFPDWVYQIGSQFNMNASTYAGHQETGGTNKGIDWAPNGVSWNTPEGAQLMTNYAKYLASTGMMEQVIYQNPFTGETVGIANGKPVGPGTDQPQYYAENWAGHQDHIHTRTSKAIPTPAQLQQLGLLGGGSPSNMAMAGTPTGVQLPQLTYTGGSGSGASGSGGLGGIRMPTPEEYAKYVSDAWMSTMNDLVKNAGQIAIGFLGSFFGLDLSKITGLANSVMGGIDLPGANSGDGGGSSDAASQLGAIPSVDAILQAAGQLPPEYQQAYVDAAMANPSQAGAILQQLQQSIGSAGVGSVQYDPSKGAEQWRPVVKSILQKVAPEYGITNLQAWEDALVKQIQTESGGNPNVDNLNDSNGKGGGTQQVFGLGQFLPSTFAAHNRTGGDIRDPVAQIFAMIDYVATKYGMDASGAPNQIGRGVGYASGGRINGPGGGRSDSIIARVSNGEYIVRAPMAQKHRGLLDAINANRLPGFADGGQAINPLFPPPPPPPVPPVTTPTPPPAPVPPDPMGPQAAADAGQPIAPAPVTDNAAPGDQASTTLQEVGSAIGQVGDAISGVADGATAPAGGDPTGDPRAVMGAAPQNLDHNKPAVSAGIQAAGSAISGAINTAVQAAAAAGTFGAGAPAAGAAAGSAGGIISGLVSAGAGAVSGAVNILSSLGVGTVTPTSGTAGAYGVPLSPETAGQQPYTGPQVVNNWNGGVHTSNNEEFYKLQQRRELQNAAPFLPQR